MKVKNFKKMVIECFNLTLSIGKFTLTLIESIFVFGLKLPLMMLIGKMSWPEYKDQWKGFLIGLGE